MPDRPTTRMNYFDRQFLRAVDFQEEQAYHIDRSQAHNRRLHTPGLLEGLLVNAVNPITITVTPGAAIDILGREIVLAKPRTMSLPNLSGTLKVYIVYNQSESDPSTDPGITGNMRIRETPDIVVQSSQPDNGVLLAEVSLTAGSLISPPNNNVRTNAAAVVDNDITVRSLTLKKDGVASASWPKLSCSQANEAALQVSSLRLDNQREIIFQDNGQIRSFDNSHKLVFNRISNLLELHEFGDIRFLTGGFSPTEKMRILANGNVGIGISNPVAKLQVSGGAIMPAVAQNINDRSSGILFPLNPGGGSEDEAFIRYFVTAGETTKLMIGVRDNQDDSIGFFQAGEERMTVYNGNVGIGNPTPQARLDVSGGNIKWGVGGLLHASGAIVSPMWKVTQVYSSQAGPIPGLPGGSFTSKGGTLLIFATGSGFATISAKIIGMTIRINDSPKGLAEVFAGELSSHKTFVANAVVATGIAAGTHKITLTPHVNTLTDFNDRFSVTVLELPFPPPSDGSVDPGPIGPGPVGPAD